MDTLAWCIRKAFTLKQRQRLVMLVNPTYCHECVTFHPDGTVRCPGCDAIMMPSAVGLNFTPCVGVQDPGKHFEGPIVEAASGEISISLPEVDEESLQTLFPPKLPDPPENPEAN